MSLINKTASEIAVMIKNKKCSSVEVTKRFLDEIEKGKDINGYISVDSDGALEAAKKADIMVAEGKAGELTGVPIAIKDNINVKDKPMTCGSKILTNYVSPFSATIVDRMQTEGMVIIGKANMDEFAIGTTGESSYFGGAKNIWDKTKTTGGSSSGSAAVVAALQAPVALGSDTGGSIRVPASFCGVVGFKPTYGSISRYGVAPVASSLDQIGPMARSVSDVQKLFNILKGQDDKDATTVNLNGFKKDYSGLKSANGLTIGILEEFMYGIDDQVIESTNLAINMLEANGAKVVRLSTKVFEHALSAYYIISSSEASSNLGKFDGVRFGFRSENHSDNYEDMFIKTRSEGFGREVQKRIMVGTYFLTTEQYHVFYTKALAVQKQIKQEFKKLFNSCNVIIGPTTATTAFESGKGSNVTEVYKSDFLTAPINLAGLPAVSVPCGLDSGNMPIGLQIIGDSFDDNLVLDVAKLYEDLSGGFPNYSMFGSVI